MDNQSRQTGYHSPGRTDFTRRSLLKQGAMLSACAVGWPLNRLPAVQQESTPDQQQTKGNGLALDQYRQFDGIGLAELVRTKQVSPSELLETAISRFG